MVMAASRPRLPSKRSSDTSSLRSHTAVRPRTLLRGVGVEDKHLVKPEASPARTAGVLCLQVVWCCGAADVFRDTGQAPRGWFWCGGGH